MISTRALLAVKHFQLRRAVLVQKQVVYFSPRIMGENQCCVCGLLCDGDQS